VRDYLQNYPRHPVVNVTWYGAVGFCNWLSRRMGLPLVYAGTEKTNAPGARLPTEAEWERAARLSGGRYPWGDESADPTRANYRQISSTGGGSPARVGSYPANPAGLWDLAGNVWEWCQDWYVPNDAPAGFAAPLFKVLRGGSWADPAESLRSQVRGKLSPDLGLSTVGFRVALSLPPGFPGSASALVNKDSTK
jgi:formylglycine-generating enzyme required for sulfatase activity